MDRCKRCGMIKYIWGTFDKQTYCWDCVEELQNQKVETMVASADKPRDYQAFSDDDLANAFWNALGRYVKRPNRRDLKKMTDMWYWAHHDSHAQATNFSRALEWCNIDMYAEKQRTDIPEE